MGVMRLIELWRQKDYKHETLFLAINILDRIMNIFASNNNIRDKMTLFIITSLFIAAKIE